jgi:hypothetical protein
MFKPVLLTLAIVALFLGGAVAQSFAPTIVVDEAHNGIDHATNPDEYQISAASGLIVHPGSYTFPLRADFEGVNPVVKGPVNAAPPPPAGAAVASKDSDPKAASPAGKPGDLQNEMARAVGTIIDAPKPDQGTPEPAVATSRNRNVPEQPSQGSVQSAVGAVIGSAKACVAGADDVSRAQVTFSSAGTVASVSVTGWAAAHGKSACVQAALKGANVGPFSRQSFTIPVPIRP